MLCIVLPVLMLCACTHEFVAITERSDCRTCKGKVASAASVATRPSGASEVVARQQNSNMPVACPIGDTPPMKHSGQPVSLHDTDCSTLVCCSSCFSGLSLTQKRHTRIAPFSVA